MRNWLLSILLQALFCVVLSGNHAIAQQRIDQTTSYIVGETCSRYLSGQSQDLSELNSHNFRGRGRVLRQRTTLGELNARLLVQSSSSQCSYIIRTNTSFLGVQQQAQIELSHFLSGIAKTFGPHRVTDEGFLFTGNGKGLLIRSTIQESNRRGIYHSSTSIIARIQN